VAAVREIPLPGEGACPSRDSGHWRRADRRTGDTRPNQRAPPDASGCWGGPALKMRSNISCTDRLRAPSRGRGPAPSPRSPQTSYANETSGQGRALRLGELIAAAP